MRQIAKNTMLVALAVLASAVAVAGCGSAAASGTNSAAEKSATGPTSGSLPTTLNAKLDEWSIKTDAPVVRAGSVKVSADNAGTMTHEVVFLKTDTPAAQLKVTNGRVSEQDSAGEVSSVRAGSTRSGTLKLGPGKYVLVCNLPGHFQQGMYTSLLVK
jgi:uncharacterized cupredoxin-like copper-binding protein